MENPRLAQPSAGALTVFATFARVVRRIWEEVRFRADLAAVAVVATAFLIVLGAAVDKYFTPDEALHFGLANLPGPIEVYRKTLTNAHPPFFFLVLHFWMRLGRSEVFLRLLPAIFGAGFLWFFYRGTRRLFGIGAALIALVILALSPVCLPISAEVRHYTLMLMLWAASLDQFERALEQESRMSMILSFLLLYLAVLTHYSAFFLVLSLAAYQAVRFLADRDARRLAKVWAACQAGVVAVYAFLYFTQVSRLRGSNMEGGAMEGWLRASYYHPGSKSFTGFADRQTREAFRFFFGSASAARFAGLLVLIGLVVLAFKRRPGVVLLATPYLLGLGAALVGVYPFGGTRHCVYLLPGFCAAIGVSLAELGARRLWRALLVPAAVACFLWRVPVWLAPPHSRVEMNVAMERLRDTVPAGSLLFADMRMGVVLEYYLGRDEFNRERYGPGRFWESNSGGYCIVGSPLWDPSPKILSGELERLIEVYRLPAGQHFWVAHLGSVGDPTRELTGRASGIVVPRPFGELHLFEVWLGETSAAVLRTPA